MAKIGINMKEAVLKKIAQDPEVSLRKLAKDSHIGYSTLCKWRRSMNLPEKIQGTSQFQNKTWTSREKFLAVVAVQSFNTLEKGEYCRRHGIYAEQLEEWEKACLHANDIGIGLTSEIREELKEAASKNRNLERELLRKEKALAEAAALLVLRKKADAIWGENGED